MVPSAAVSAASSPAPTRSPSPLDNASDAAVESYGSVSGDEDPEETLGTYQALMPDPSTYYLRYYWWEIIVYNINITGPTNLGPYMRYYWMGPSSIKYAILVGRPNIFNVG